MITSLSAVLAGLLEDTQRLLAEAEPTLADWQNYSRRRNDLFQKLQNAPQAVAPGGSEREALARLYSSVLENDRRLMSKIAERLSAIGRELGSLTEQRRAIKAYDVGSSRRTFHRFTA